MLTFRCCNPWYYCQARVTANVEARLAILGGEGDGWAACDLEAEGAAETGSGHRAIAAQFRRHAGAQLAALVADRDVQNSDRK